MAIQILGTCEDTPLLSASSSLLGSPLPEPLQMALLGALSNSPAMAAGEMILDAWKRFPPAPRLEAIRVLLSRENWTLAFLRRGVEDPTLTSQVDNVRRGILRKHQNPDIKKLAENLFKDTPSNSRLEIINRYASALTLPGDLNRGAAVFERECSACHRVLGKGVEIGPNLASSASRDPAPLLRNILAPNDYVLPQYEQYVVLDKSGRTHQGMIASQSASSVTLKRDKNVTEDLLRNEIDELVSTGKSLMPEGLEQKITPQEMADLIEFLRQAQAAEPSPRIPLEIGTEPGLVEP